MKTLVKLYPNGDFDLMGNTLVESGINNDYTFNDGTITVPSLVKYAPPEYRNYYVRKNNRIGYPNTSDAIGKPMELIDPNEGDRTSDKIDVSGWGNLTLKVSFLNMNGWYSAFVTTLFLDENENVVSIDFDNRVSDQRNGNFHFTRKVETNYKYFIVSSTYFDVPGVIVNTTVERGDTNNPVYYDAYEDLPNWVKPPTNEISMQSDGLVIRGTLRNNGELML